MSSERPNPKELLEAIALGESQEKRGKLKIFLGLAAGVGKTFAMLKEANKLKAAGVDVIIGIVDTHGRKETAALLEGLTIYPMKIQIYKDREFYELDVDGIIALHPQIVLVDELAHHNVPGSKHAKRWQDVVEILEHGIDVFTTLNIQHIESLNDIIRSITDINVRETVPDHVVDLAYSIQLVDLTPEELLERLREGRVYFDEQSKIASLNFFQKEKLTALREIALRYAADKVDRDLRKLTIQEEKMVDWKPREKFLTAISTNPNAQKLIRTTKRLASTNDAPWIAAYIDNGASLNETEKEQLERNLALARDLGAEVITLSDPSIVEGIKRLSKQRGITRIIVGRPVKGFFNQFFRGFSLVDQLIRECQDADIHIIREEKNPVYLHRSFLQTHWKSYLTITLFTTAIALASWLLITTIEFQNNHAIILLALYLITALIAGIFIVRERSHMQMLIKNEESLYALYDMVKQIASAPSQEALLKLLKKNFEKLLHGSCEFVIKKPDGSMDWNELKLIPNEKEKSTAVWASKHGKEAGFSTDTLPTAENLYIPLQAYNKMFGLFIYRPEKQQLLSAEDKNFIYTVCHQLSNYLDRHFEKEKITQHENLMQMQKINKMILDRFAHAFQWPITNAQSALKSLQNSLKIHKNKQQYPEIDEMGHSLDVFAKNLTNIATMAELSEGMIPLKKASYSIKDAIEECILFATPLLNNHSIKITLGEDLPTVEFDYYLIQVLLNNLLLNVLENSLPETPIEIDARQEGNHLVISLADYGLQMTYEEMSDLDSEPLARTSLGLGIARTIAELHQGSLTITNLPGKGTRFTLTLPIGNPI